MDYSEEQATLFREAIICVFSKWTALNLAITNEWGGAGGNSRRDEIIEELITMIVDEGKFYNDVST